MSTRKERRINYCKAVIAEVDRLLSLEETQSDIELMRKLRRLKGEREGMLRALEAEPKVHPSLVVPKESKYDRIIALRKAQKAASEERNAPAS